MNAEQFQDALNHLDEDLLLETDRLRQQKKRPVLWHIAGLAACLCLIVGIGLGFSLPMKHANETAGDCYQSSPESAGSFYYSSQDAHRPELPEETVAGTGEPLMLTVTAQDGNVLTATVCEDGIFPKGTQVTLKLETAPETVCQGQITVSVTRWAETADGIVVYALKTS